MLTASGCGPVLLSRANMPNAPAHLPPGASVAAGGAPARVGHSGIGYIALGWNTGAAWLGRGARWSRPRAMAGASRQFWARQVRHGCSSPGRYIREEFRNRRVLLQIPVFEPGKRPLKKAAISLFSLTVDGLWSSTAFGERESERGILRPKTASDGSIRPQLFGKPKRPGLRQRRRNEHQ